MRKSTKVCLIVALVFFVLSIGCMVTSAVVGENPITAIKEIVENGWGAIIATEDYDQQFDQNYDMSQFTMIEECDADKIDVLQVKVGIGSVVIRPVTGDSCKVWVEGDADSDGVQISDEGNCLTVKDDTYGKDVNVYEIFSNSWKKLADRESRHLIVEIPDKEWKSVELLVQYGAVKLYDLDVTALNVEVEAGCAYGSGMQTCDTANLTVDLGNIIWENLESRKLNVNVEAGNIQMLSARADKLQANCEMGNLSFDSVHAASMQADCQMGNIDIQLAGKKEDYFISYDTEMGDVEIEGGREKRNSQASNEVELDCEMGDITVSFLGGETSTY